MRRILFISPAANLGGAERCLLETLKCLDSQQFEVHVIFLEDGPLQEAVLAHVAGVEILPLPKVLSRAGDHGGGLVHKLQVGISLFWYLCKLRRVFYRLHPSILHANGIKAHLLGSLAKPRKGCHLVWHIHDYISQRGTSCSLLAKQAHKCDLAICNSRSVEEDFLKVCSDVPSTTIYNAFAVPPTVPSPSKRLCRIGLVGTYANWKGHQLFLEAVSHHQEDFRARGLHFPIIGGPVYLTAGSQVLLSDLEAIASDYSISDLVQFHSFEANLDSVYSKLDVLVNASVRAEPFGRTLIEAMTYGKPVIAPAEGGPLEIFEDGVSGFHFQPRDAVSLADTFLRVVDHPDVSALVETAHLNVQEKFSHKMLNREMSAAYGKL